MPLTACQNMRQICLMSRTYQDAMIAVAQAYQDAVAIRGGISLARVATIVVNRGSFFSRLSDDTSFSVRNLERFADWFRRPSNWPNHSVSPEAAEALASIGRPVDLAADLPMLPKPVSSNRDAGLHGERAA